MWKRQTAVQPRSIALNSKQNQQQFSPALMYCLPSSVRAKPACGGAAVVLRCLKSSRRRPRMETPGHGGSFLPQVRRNFDPAFSDSRSSPASSTLDVITSSSLESRALQDHTLLCDVVIGRLASKSLVSGSMLSSLIAVFGMLHSSRVGFLGCGWRLARRPLFHGRGYHVAAAAAAASAATPVSSRLKMPSIAVGGGGTKPTIDFAEYRELEELASRVVNGIAARVSAML